MYSFSVLLTVDIMDQSIGADVIHQSIGSDIFDQSMGADITDQSEYILIQYKRKSTYMYR